MGGGALSSDCHARAGSDLSVDGTPVDPHATDLPHRELREPQNQKR